MIKSNKGFVFAVATVCFGATMMLGSQVYAQAVKVDAVSI